MDYEMISRMLAADPPPKGWWAREGTDETTEDREYDAQVERVELDGGEDMLVVRFRECEG